MNIPEGGWGVIRPCLVGVSLSSAPESFIPQILSLDWLFQACQTQTLGSLRTKCSLRRFNQTGKDVESEGRNAFFLQKVSVFICLRHGPLQA